MSCTACFILSDSSAKKMIGNWCTAFSALSVMHYGMKSGKFFAAKVEGQQTTLQCLLSVCHKS